MTDNSDDKVRAADVLLAQHMKDEEMWQAKHDLVHSDIKEALGKQYDDLAEIKGAMRGREKYEHGIKHGIAGLWAAAVAVGAVFYTWLTKK